MISAFAKALLHPPRELSILEPMTSLDLQNMSREDKLKVMHSLWEDLAREDAEIDSPSWHGEALRETEQRVQSGTERSLDWEEAKEQLRRRAR